MMASDGRDGVERGGAGMKFGGWRDEIEGACGGREGGKG